MCVRNWVDKNISQHGVAPQVGPLPYDLPASSDALHHGKWNDEGTNFVIEKCVHDNDLKILEMGAGYLYILDKQRHWNKRYFVVLDGTLQYFQNHENINQCLGAVYLHKAMLNRYEFESFQREGCLTITETIKTTKEYARDCTDTAFDSGPFIVSTTTTRRDDWICLLDRTIYTLLVREGKAMKQKEQDDSVLPHCVKSPDAAVGLQDQQFKMLKRLLIEGVDSNLQCVIEMLLSDDMSEVIALIESIPTSANDKVAKALVQVSLMISEGNTCQLLEMVSKREINKTISEELLFRLDSLSSKMLTYYTRDVAYGYLRSMLSECVHQMTLDSTKKRMSFELDPIRLVYDITIDEQKIIANWVSTYKNDEDHEGFKHLDEEMGRLVVTLEDGGQRLRSLITQILTNKRHLEDATRTILRRITSSIHYAPRRLRGILYYVQAAVREKFPESRWSAVGAIMFLRFVCPALSTGTISKGVISRRATMTPVAQRNLLIVTKILQSLANHSKFGSKEKFMFLLHGFIEREMKSFHDFCHTFSDPSNPDLTMNCVTDSPDYILTKVEEVKDHLIVLKEMIDKNRKKSLEELDLSSRQDSTDTESKDKLKSPPRSELSPPPKLPSPSKLPPPLPDLAIRSKKRSVKHSPTHDPRSKGTPKTPPPLPNQRLSGSRSPNTKSMNSLAYSPSSSPANSRSNSRHKSNTSRIEERKVGLTMETTRSSPAGDSKSASRTRASKQPPSPSTNSPSQNPKNSNKQ